MNSELPPMTPQHRQNGIAEWELQADMSVLWVNGARFELRIPAGFKTDLASIPRLLWAIFPPTGKNMRAAIVHDYCYRQRVPFSRFLADAVFREIMIRDGVPAWRRMAMYYAVRAFGWLWWSKGEKQS